MTAPELARKALACLVSWRCASEKCRHELYEIPSNAWKCPRCGLESHSHGLFSDDREALLKMLKREARKKA